MKSFLYVAEVKPPPPYTWLITSLGCLTVVVADPSLLPEFESALELTVAVFEINVPSVTDVPTRTTRVKIADPTEKLEFEQLIAPVPPIDGCVGQVHPAAGVIDLKVVFVGVVSDSVAFGAASGPLFVTVIV